MADQWASTEDFAPTPVGSGGWSSTEDHAPQPEQTSGPITRFASNLWNKSIGSMIPLLKRAMGTEELDKAYESAKSGNYAEAGNTLANWAGPIYNPLKAPGERVATAVAQPMIQGAKDRVEQIQHAAQALKEGRLEDAVTHGMTAIFPERTEQVQKAVQAVKDGHAPDALAHIAAAIVGGEDAATMANSAEQMRGGDVAGGIGSAIAPAVNTGLAVIGGLEAPESSAATPMATTPEAAFAAEHKFPIPRSVEANNKVVSGLESHLSNALGSSGVMREAADATRQGLSRIGGELADKVAPVTTPQIAGEALQDSAASRNAAIEAAKSEQDQMLAEKGEKVADTISPTPATPETAGAGAAGTLKATEKAHGAGASAAYQRLADIENSPENLKTVKTGEKASPEVDKWAQALANKNYADLSPEDQARVNSTMKTVGLKPTIDTTADIALPVDMRPVKQSLQTVYDQLKSTMPIAQQQASRGLKAIENIINGDDYVSASTADTNLGAVKAIEREAPNDKTTFLARKAIDAFSPAVDAAISSAGPEAADALQQGRALTRAKYATRDTFEQLPTEPVQIYRTLTAPSDTNINLLRDVKAKAPQSIPAIGRAMVQGLMDDAHTSGIEKGARSWAKIGDATKLELLGTHEKVAAVDSYFNTAKELNASPVPAGMEGAGPPVKAEPVAAYSRLVQPKDTAITALKEAAQAYPETIPKIARAKIDELIQMATEGNKPGTAESAWKALGQNTKEILYPNPLMRKQLDDFFSTARKTAEAIDRNTSKTAYVQTAKETVNVFIKEAAKALAGKGVSAATLGAYPAMNYALAKILTSPGGAMKLGAAFNLAAKASLTGAEALQLSALTKQIMQTAGVEQKQIQAAPLSIPTDSKTPVSANSTR